VARNCDSSASLQALLNEANRLTPRIVYQTSQIEQLLDALAVLRAYKRDGYPADISPGKTLLHYRLAQLEGGFGEYPKFMVEKLPLGDSRRREFEKRLAGMREKIGPITLTPLHALRVGKAVAPEFILLMESNQDVADPLEVAYWDLARLKVAGLLAEKTGSWDGSTTPTASALILPEPLDPYSGGSYRWHGGTKQFYSVGPDKSDDNLRTEIYYLDYSSRSNPGDIAIPYSGAIVDPPWY